jgi:predicted nucleic acid-binding protein
MGRRRVTIVDTDILIDAGRGIHEAIECLKDIKAKSTLAVSAVTHMELIVGCRNKSEVQKLDKFLKQFQIVPLDVAISGKAIDLLRRYRLSHGLLIADSSFHGPL